jgi:hypothetical protein
MSITWEILEDQIKPLRSSREIKEIGMIKISRPLSKIICLLMKERKKM